MIYFEYMNAKMFPSLSAALFGILATNMSTIAPTGNTYEADFSSWHTAVSNGLTNENRRIILIRNDDERIGFFQYFTNKNKLFMTEEIQLITAWQGSGHVFRRLYEFIVPYLPGIKTVAAYANHRNKKSQRILEKLGLRVIGESKSGNSYHYRSQFSAFLDWLHCK